MKELKALDQKEAISGKKMAEYLRLLANTLETSDKQFTAKLTISVFPEKAVQS